MSDPLIGAQLDEYRLESLLGQGGMARVYRGLDTGLHRYAAIKVIDTPHQQDEGYIARFEREARAIAALDHPHIVTVYRYGRAHNLLYLAMKYIEGADLHTILNGYEQDGQLMPLPEVVRLLREMGAALDYAHSRGVIHRDVKPSNVMVDGQGRSYITDFGLALLADVGTRGEILGSPLYIAPEQAVSSAGAVPQSDLYALGVILYRMVTGQLPFVHDDLLELLMLHMTAVPPAPRTIRPEISPALEAVLLRALEKEPSARFPSGQALADAVESALREPTAVPLMAAPTLTIVDRVALGMDTLPPIPAAVTPLMPAAPPTTPSPPAPGFSFSPRLVGGVLVLLTLIAAAVFLFRGGADEGEVVGETAVAATATTVNAGIPAAETSEVVDISLPGPGETITPTFIDTATPEAAESATPESALPAPDAGAEIYLPVIVAALAEAATLPDTPPPPPSPTTTPLPVVLPYTLIFERKGNTLFMTNSSAGALLLAGLEIGRGRDGRQRFSDWPPTLLPAGACLHLSQRARGATDDISDTACVQLLGDLLVYNWREEFSVWYNGQEVQSCDLDDERRCVVSWQP
ncbi:MAG TPA: serine/threonine-protein kinase [Chloroflexota bacterium]|nr:serine/threonine-protein kinase [Chloroflexota bacterium]